VLLHIHFGVIDVKFLLLGKGAAGSLEASLRAETRASKPDCPRPEGPGIQGPYFPKPRVKALLAAVSSRTLRALLGYFECVQHKLCSDYARHGGAQCHSAYCILQVEKSAQIPPMLRSQPQSHPSSKRMIPASLIMLELLPQVGDIRCDAEISFELTVNTDIVHPSLRGDFRS
jgi:hypothetical protein